jgi:multidrug efflux system membrane fusion protein
VDQQTVLNVNRWLREGKLRADGGPGPAVQVGLQSEPDFPHRGRIESVVVPLNPSSGGALWRVVVRDSDRLLLPGMFVRVRLVFPPRTTTLVAQQALISWGPKSGTLAIATDQNEVVVREVKLGSSHGSLRTVTEGLRPDEWVVIDRVSGGGFEGGIDPQRVPMPNQSSRSAESPR